MQPYLFSIWVVVGLAVLFAAHAWLKGRGLLGHRERPERIVGRRLTLVEFDWLASAPTEAVVGTVREYVEPRYRVEFEPPVLVANLPERHAWIGSRHKGWPVSGARRGRNLAVAGEFESGAAFIALARRA